MNTVFRIPLLCAAGLLLFIGCGRDDGTDAAKTQRPDSASATQPVDFSGRIPIDTLHVDMTGDGAEELVIASRSDSLENDPMFSGSFDRVDILTGEAGSRRRLFFDVVDYGRSMEAREVTGDSVPDVVVLLDAGGNNPIASRGMHLYGRGRGGEVTLLFYAPSGLPTLQDLNADGSMEILVSDQFWGMVAHSEVIGFTTEIYTFDGESYVPAGDRFPGYYGPIIARKRAAYEKARRDGGTGEDVRGRLYMRAAELLVWSYARGGAREASTVWRAERDALRGALSSDQFDDLAAFVDEIQTMHDRKTDLLP